MKNKIALRKWQLADAKSLTAIANNINIASNLRDAFPFPYKEDNAIQFINMAINAKEDESIFFAILYESSIIGGIGGNKKADVYSKNFEIGYWLGEKYWNKGIATYCVSFLIKYIFSNYDTHRIYAEIFSNNISSQKVLIKNGFREEAVLKQNVFKNGQYVDSHVFSILKTDFLLK